MLKINNHKNRQHVQTNQQNLLYPPGCGNILGRLLWFLHVHAEYVHFPALRVFGPEWSLYGGLEL
jgi:hypothetical protein